MKAIKSSDELKVTGERRVQSMPPCSERVEVQLLQKRAGAVP
jgi:hypothetical protein